MILSNPAKLQPLSDKAAIGLSLLCALHCLAVPLLVSLLPSIAAIGLADESFHRWIVLGVIPLSIFALTLGCNRHGAKGVLLTGIVGISILCLTAFLGHDLLGEAAEKWMTLTGAMLVATSHIRNYHLCQRRDSCECPQ